MNSLALYLSKTIERECENSKSTNHIICINSIEDLKVYYEICKNISQYANKKGMDLIAKLSKKKYEHFFQKDNNDYLKLMQENDWIDNEGRMTYYRNLASTKSNKQIILLMGTEVVDDKGGLADFYTIDPQSITKKIANQYNELIPANYLDNALFIASFNLFYSNLFKYIEKDITRLCKQIDYWINNEFSDTEIWESMFKELPKTWGIPPVIDDIPSLAKTAKAKEVKILDAACKFILRVPYKKITKTDFLNILKCFDKYENDQKKYYIDYPDGQGHESYQKLKESIIQYVTNRELQTNRELFLQTDFSIVNDIITIKLDKKVKQSKAKKVSGDPLSVFLTMFLETAEASSEEIQDFNKVLFCIESIDLGLKGYISEDYDVKAAEIWGNICNYIGGIETFIQSETWREEENLSFALEPQGVFIPQNVSVFINNGYIVNKPSSNNHKISINVKLVDCNDETGEESLIEEKKYDWIISPDNEWLITFDLLPEAEHSLINYVPFYTWENINDAYRAKSKEEFIQLITQADLNRDISVDIQQLVSAFSEDYINEKFYFNKLGQAFVNFSQDVKRNGFYNTFLSTTPVFIEAYCSLGKLFRGKPNTNERNLCLRYFVNSFMIAQDARPISTDITVEQCIILPYHPAMLEKIVDRMVFIRQGMAEWYIKHSKNETTESLMHALERYADLSYIHTAVDAVNANDYIEVNKVYGHYVLYGKYKEDNKFIRIGSVLQKEEVFDDDFQSNFNSMNAEAKMLMNVLCNYAKTYNEKLKNMVVAFVNPIDLQTIVSAVTNFIKTQKEILSEDEKIFVELRIIQTDTNKGGRNYLAYWLDNMTDSFENVRVETYMDYWKDYEDIQTKIPDRTDIVFFMDIMHISQDTKIKFEKLNYNSEYNKLECRYPMVFKPNVAFETSISRTVDITQPQFYASTVHTQALSYYDIKEISYDRKFVRIEKLDSGLQSVISKSHEKAVWVVCIDDALDRKGVRELHGGNKCPIIGFSTGQGAFGQLNVTITTRENVSKDIKMRCKSRLKSLFLKWADEELNKASETCISRADRLDGTSVLMALNPSAYEINNYLAYLLVDKICEESLEDYVLIRLDSYRHWFQKQLRTGVNVDNEGLIPDFMLLKFEVNENNALHINAKILESKIAKYENAEQHLNKAVEQVSNGINVLSKHFSPKNKTVENRYWFSQLYRAVLFVKDSIKSVDIGERIDSILTGDYSIEWSGEIYGFWMNSVEENINKEDHSLSQYIITSKHIGQKEIQRLLLDKASTEDIKYVDIGAVEESDELDCDIEEEQESFEEHTQEILVVDYDQEITETIQNKEEQAQPVDVNPVDVDDSTKLDIQNDKYEMNSNAAVEIKPLEDVRILLGTDKKNEEIYWEFGHKMLSNRHLLVTGTSGQGKTYCIQALLLELSRQNISSVIFDYTDGFLPNKLEPEFVSGMNDKIDQKVAIIHKIPVNPFLQQEIEIPGFGSYPEDSSVVAGRIADILTHVYDFGEQQFSAVYTACKEGLDKYKSDMDFAKLKKMLEDNQYKESQKVLSKMAQFFDRDLFDTKNSLDWRNVTERNGKVTVIQLTNLDRQLQTIVTEITLWDAWYSLRKFGDKSMPFVVVLDEAQNLSFKEGSPAEKILREGRKYGWSAWFATQFLKGALGSGEISNLQQAAERLYFKPSGEEMAYIAGQIAEDKSTVSDWLSILKNMQKGQCIVQGDRIKKNGQFGAAKAAVVNITSLGDR